ncbi:hypothetical protein [Nakamurella aerolata]|uniref:Uncharacterized protein n=1 Tax=Nakamurella aerolata TaxID=1656892 RepID=A0A849AAU0_9ACTN|nr:hypothetical protein [Nakamurella aerolata]NNG36753.1 hypothetical protein [Nakamurella aerolata]
MVQLTLSGDPTSIRASGLAWNTFGGDAATAGGGIRTLQTNECMGQELVDLVNAYKEGLPPRLDKVDRAWTMVGAALVTYAGTLEGLQRRMQSVALRYTSQQTAVSNANTALGSARRADSTHAQSRKSQQQLLDPGEKLPADGYVSQVGAKQTALSNARTTLHNIEGEAAQILREHDAAVRTLNGQINDAKALRPDSPPGWLERKWQGIKDFVVSHAGTLKMISAVLKTVAAIATVLSFVPGLNVVMGPIALVAGGIALGLDVLMKLSGVPGMSWSQIGIDAVGLIPGGRSLRLLSATGKMGKFARGARAIDPFMSKAETVGSYYVAGQTTYQAANDIKNKNFADAALAVTGVKVPGLGQRAKNVQAIATNSGNFVNGEYKAVKYWNDPNAKWYDRMYSVAAPATAAGKAGITRYNAKKYATAGTHPFDGSARKAGEAPVLGSAQAKQVRRGWYSSAALDYAVRTGPTRAPAQPSPTSVHSPAVAGQRPPRLPGASTGPSGSVRGPFAPGQRVARLPGARG